MILTVEEAKKKFCPRTMRAQENGCNLVLICEGDQCMAWRWFETEFSHREIWHITPLPEEIYNLPPDEKSAKREEEWVQKHKPEGEGWIFNDEEFTWVKLHPEKRRGFCGLAGKLE